MSIDLGIKIISTEVADSIDLGHTSMLRLQHDLDSTKLNTIHKLLDLAVSKDIIQQLITDDISNVSTEELSQLIIEASNQVDNSFIDAISSEGFWTTLKYTFTRDSKVQEIIEEAGAKIKRFNKDEWSAFLNKKVTTTCYLKKQAEAMLEALSSVTRGLIDYYNLIDHYGWIYDPDSVERVKYYDPMQYKAILAQLKPMLEKGDAIYTKLTKKGTYDAALTGRYQPVKSASLTALGFDKSSVISLLNKHAHDSAGCKNIIEKLNNLCGNYGYDNESSSSTRVETSYDSDGNVSTSVKDVTEIKYIAKQSFIQITKLAQLAITIYTPLDKFIYAIAKNVEK